MSLNGVCNLVYFINLLIHLLASAIPPAHILKHTRKTFFFKIHIYWDMLLCLITQSCPTLCDPVDCSPPGSSVHGDSPGKNSGMGCHSLLQGIFLIQGSNPGLSNCRRSLYCLSHRGIVDWKCCDSFCCPAKWIVYTYIHSFLFIYFGSSLRCAGFSLRRLLVLRAEALGVPASVGSAHRL